MSIWSFPTKIVFGAGEVRRLGDEVAALGVSRVLVVSDPGVERAGLLSAALAALSEKGIAAGVFTGVEGNPTEQNIEDGTRAYAEERAQAVVAVGGGSPMDAGKLIALRAKCSLPFEQLDDAIDGGGVTAATGFDALTHCIEAYLSLGDHPLADAIALGGIELAQRFLQRAVEAADDLEARGGMMKAAMMGAIAFQKGLGACHSLAHPLSSEHGLHHGLANALCLPAVMAFNASSSPERVRRIGALLGDADAAFAISALRARVGINAGLAGSGIEEQHLPPLAKKALADACHRGNPRPCSEQDLLDLYRASL